MEDISLSTQKDDFVSWLTDVTTAYNSLSSNHRNILLEHLITNSEPNQLSFLSTHLPVLLCRDFISYLPSELVSAILKHLSGRQILHCRQVCKSWKKRINSLTDLWQAKAFDAGVDVQAIALKHKEFIERSRIYRRKYCLAKKFLFNLKHRRVSLERVPNIEVPHGEETTDVCFSDKHIIVGECCVGRIKIWSMPNWTLEHSFNIKPFDSILAYKNSQLYTSLNATLASWNVDSGAKRCEFVGHTSMILSVDVTMDNRFVITGSADKTVKVWIVHNTETVPELFMTLDNAHTGHVSEVSFLPCGEHGELRFISCNALRLLSWSIDTQTRRKEYSQVVLLQEKNEIGSMYFDISKPEIMFITQWNFKTKLSALTSYPSHSHSPSTTRLEPKQTWHLPTKGFKARLLGAGSRFALLVCSISLRDFLLFDLITGSALVTFTISRYNDCQKPPIRLYHNTSWLNGFGFDKNHGEKPACLGLDQRRQIVIGIFDFPEVDADTESLD